jgi:hypothetical protein
VFFLVNGGLMAAVALMARARTDQARCRFDSGLPLQFNFDKGIKNERKK